MAGKITRKQLHAKLAKLDPAIARAYKNSFNRAGPTEFFGSFGRTDAQAVLNAAIADDQLITPDEAQALCLIIDNNDFRVDSQGRSAKDELLRLILDRQDQIYDGCAERVFDSSKLGLIYNALSLTNVKKVRFRSPATGVRFEPHHYQVIKKYIQDTKIKVYRVDTRGLLGVIRKQVDGGVRLGQYSGDDSQPHNRLSIPSNVLGRREFTVSVVHEATHAIHDFRDISRLFKLREADALVAGGIVAHKIGHSYRKASPTPESIAFHGASKMVIDEVASGRKWKNAYFDVVRAVRTAVGKTAAGVVNQENMKDRKAFKRVLKKLKKK